MNRQTLDLYNWEPGVCFRHPERGEVATALLKTLHPRGADAREVRACEDCLVAIERERREARRAAEGRRGPGQADGQTG
jgi:hypothetical protein